MTSIPFDMTLEEVRKEIFDFITEAAETEGEIPVTLNLNRGLFRGLVEVWGFSTFQLYVFMKVILDQAFPSSASGAWLDLHAQQVNLTRKSETKAEGNVTFYREDSVGNVVIPAGRIVKTQPDNQGTILRFITTAETILPDGQTSVLVPIISEEYGSKNNLASGQIVEMTTFVEGIDGVTNTSSWLTKEGTDVETDDSLRARYVLAWSEINGCTKYAYKSWAMSVTGTVDANIKDQHPRGQGTVDVILKGTAGIPTQDLIDSVDELIQAKKPINDDVLLKAPTAVPITIEAEIEYVIGDEAAIIQEAAQRLTALFLAEETIEGVAPLEIGQDVPVDLLTHTILAVRGTKKVNWTSPSSDTTVDDESLATLVSINLTATAVEE